MLDEKRIKESKKRFEKLLNDKDIEKGVKGRFVGFFLDNSKNSLETAKLLFDVSIKGELKKSVGLPDFNGFLWVINASYYSMFYMARALLEDNGIRIKTDFSVHIAAFDALIYYFYLTGKIEKIMIEEFHEAKEEAQELLSKEKAKEIVEYYIQEREKRSKFTYEMGEIALQNKAQTSLERARRFNESIRKMIEY